MPVAVYDKFDSGDMATNGISKGSLDLAFSLEGTEDYAAALGALQGYAPANLFSGQMVRQTCEVKYLGLGRWDGTAHYEQPPAPQYAFDTAGGTQHIVQARATLFSAGIDNNSASDHHGAIGVTKNGIEGVDITVPVFSFSETHYITADLMTDAYKGVLYFLTGKTNNAPFKGCNAGECLFMGASGSLRGDGRWEVQFKFAGSPNKTGLYFPDAPEWVQPTGSDGYSPGQIVRHAPPPGTVMRRWQCITIGGTTQIEPDFQHNMDWTNLGECAGPFNKGGWEYLWTEYEDYVDNNSKRMARRLLAVYIDQVYDAGDFSQLAIGV